MPNNGTTTSGINGTTTISTVISSGAANATTSSNGTIITFPSASSTMNVTSLSTTVELTSTPSIASDFTFVTGSSLLVATTSSSTPSATATDPDQPATTLSILPQSTTAAADSTPTQPVLPNNIPWQILPPTGAHPGDGDLGGYTEISLLFDTALNWLFVATNQNSSSEIFAWMPPILQTLLQTTWNGWIPSDSVDTLAQQLRVASSPFYTALPSPYKDLAVHVVPSFPVETANNDGTPGSGSGSSSDTTGASSSSKTREDAIIGVISSLGAIALLILAFLVFRAVKQRRELAHRRLSDPGQNAEFIGAPPEDHEFDRDSVGGQRRRSFYYAADSLRSAQPTAAEDPFNPGMRERRPPIGAPILRDNTMNW
ncbi:hypothetical protein FKP32DRAFT_1569409 [Trametes sanguinea]|nr:hypothetical protein FKP32DRAFT_1569409 [Trametes sanguinea]